MTTEQEKYQRYLCSREWNVLREQVRFRSGGRCERCYLAEMTAVHHLTYERKYHEDLADLQAICGECHEFVHAKGGVVFRPTGKNIYLAGKVSRNDWRHALVPGLDTRNAVGEPPDWSVIPNTLHWTADNQVVYGFGYSGPFFMNSEHGLSHGDGTHGFGTSGYTADLPYPYDKTTSQHHGYRLREFTRAHCLDAIRESSGIFAWIDDVTAFGTLVELGFATAHRFECHIVIGFPREFTQIDDFWFAQECSRAVIQCADVSEFINQAMQSLFNWTIRPSL
jgi:hypothetical protein